MNYSKEELSALRREVKSRLSARRFEHTVAVERSAVALGRILLPDDVFELAAAALLHDIAKELSYAAQEELLLSDGVKLTENDRETPAVFHSFAAPAVIKRDFPAYATEKILSAVFRHTVGDAGLSTFDKIILISDYAEETRTYASCVAIRHELFDGLTLLSPEEALRRLDIAVIDSIDCTEKNISARGQTVNLRMLAAKQTILDSTDLFTDLP